MRPLFIVALLARVISLLQIYNRHRDTFLPVMAAENYSRLDDSVELAPKDSVAHMAN